MKPYLFIALALLTSCAKSKEDKPVPLPAPKVSTMDITFLGKRYELRDTLGDTNYRLNLTAGRNQLDLSINTPQVRLPIYNFMKIDTSRLGTYQTNYMYAIIVNDSIYSSSYIHNSVTLAVEDEEKYEGQLSFLISVDDTGRKAPFEGVFKIYKPK